MNEWSGVNRFLCLKNVALNFGIWLFLTVSSEWLKPWILQADVDGDGSLNYGEFVAVSVHLKKMANDEHLHKAFSFFDRNQSGFIEIEELRNALNEEVDTSGEDVINAIMHDVDTDKVSVQYINSKVHDSESDS